MPPAPIPPATQKKRPFSLTGLTDHTVANTLRQLRQYRGYTDFTKVILPPVGPPQPKKDASKPSAPRLSLRSLIEETTPRVVKKPSLNSAPNLGLPTVYRSLPVVPLPDIPL